MKWVKMNVVRWHFFFAHSLSIIFNLHKLLSAQRKVQTQKTTSQLTFLTGGCRRTPLTLIKWIAREKKRELFEYSETFSSSTLYHISSVTRQWWNVLVDLRVIIHSNHSQWRHSISHVAAHSIIIVTCCCRRRCLCISSFCNASIHMGCTASQLISHLETSDGREEKNDTRRPISSQINFACSWTATEQKKVEQIQPMAIFAYKSADKCASQ